LLQPMLRQERDQLATLDGTRIDPARVVEVRDAVLLPPPDVTTDDDVTDFEAHAVMLPPIDTPHQGETTIDLQRLAPLAPTTTAHTRDARDVLLDLARRRRTTSTEGRLQRLTLPLQVTQVTLGEPRRDLPRAINQRRVVRLCRCFRSEQTPIPVTDPHVLDRH